MLTGSRSIGRSSENTSMRSTSFTMRSASSQISRVSARSSSLTDDSRSCAAPRMPDSGFLISWASIAARPVTVRAAPRWVSWRSILSAIDRSWSTTTTPSWRSSSGRRIDVDDALAAVPRRADVDAVFVDRRGALAHLLDERQERAAEGHEIGERVAAQDVGRGLEKCLGGRVGLERSPPACRRAGPDAAARRARHRRRRLAGALRGRVGASTLTPPSSRPPWRRHSASSRKDSSGRGSVMIGVTELDRDWQSGAVDVPAEMLAGAARRLSGP